MRLLQPMTAGALLHERVGAQVQVCVRACVRGWVVCLGVDVGVYVYSAVTIFTSKLASTAHPPPP